MVANSWLVIFQVKQQNSMTSRTQTGFLLSTWENWGSLGNETNNNMARNNKSNEQEKWIRILRWRADDASDSLNCGDYLGIFFNGELELNS